DDGRQYTVLANGDDITWEIRRPEVDADVSQVSAYPGVRRSLSARQREIGAEGRVVMVGRDIGTVVLPDADLKIYLEASPQERARRRVAQLDERGGQASYEVILAEMLRRDAYDSDRDLAPLRPAGDALVLDTEGRTEDETAEASLALVEAWRSSPVRER
ncbi:MAG: (d)CMP kinase, partial [Anaerolineae bacterium]